MEIGAYQTQRFDPTTIMEKINGQNGKICGKIAFPRYMESVKFRPQSENSFKRKPYR